MRTALDAQNQLAPATHGTRTSRMNMNSATNMLHSIGLIAIAVLMTCAPTEANAQGGVRGGVFVAIPEAFPDIDARAVIIRENGKDVILLRSQEATPDVLSMSLVALRRVRRDHPAPEDGQMIPIVGFVVTTPMSEEHLRDMESTLARLVARPIRQVGNLGPGRWIRYRAR
jgi:hypothetical protein